MVAGDGKALALGEGLLLFASLEDERGRDDGAGARERVDDDADVGLVVVARGAAVGLAGVEGVDLGAVVGLARAKDLLVADREVDDALLGVAHLAAENVDAGRVFLAALGGETGLEDVLGCEALLAHVRAVELKKHRERAELEDLLRRHRQLGERQRLHRHVALE